MGRGSGSKEEEEEEAAGGPQEEEVERRRSKRWSASSAGLSRAKETLGVMRDGVQAAAPAVEKGFRAAQRGVNLGFAATRKVLKSPFKLAREAGINVDPRAEASLDALLDGTHAIASLGVGASSAITKAALGVTDAALEKAGGSRGELYRQLKEFIEENEALKTNRTTTALLGVAALLFELQSSLTTKDPRKIVAGAQALALVHRGNREARREARFELGTFDPALPSEAELKDWARFMKFSAAAYGFQLVVMWGMLPENQPRRSNLSSKTVITKLTGVKKEDIVVLEQKGSLYRPGHFVAVDHAEKQVILAIRGTFRLQDVLVDLVCETEQFVSVEEEDGEEELLVAGWAHSGFLRSAERLNEELEDTVKATLLEHDGYELVVCGHSLGGGVSTILALMWARVPLFRERNVRAFAFAAPCSVSADIALAPFTRAHVTSVVSGDDVVSRLSLDTYRELQRNILALSPDNDIAPDERAAMLENLPSLDSERKLFCAGHVWWLESGEYEPHPVVPIDPTEELCAIELFPNMFSIHLPHFYVQTTEQLLASFED